MVGKSFRNAFHSSIALPSVASIVFLLVFLDVPSPIVFLFHDRIVDRSTPNTHFPTSVVVVVAVLVVVVGSNDVIATFAAAKRSHFLRTLLSIFGSSETLFGMFIAFFALLVNETILLKTCQGVPRGVLVFDCSPMKDIP